MKYFSIFTAAAISIFIFYSTFTNNKYMAIVHTNNLIIIVDNINIQACKYVINGVLSVNEIGFVEGYCIDRNNGFYAYKKENINEKKRKTIDKWPMVY